MRVYIYYCEWDGKHGSHDLLRHAVYRYLDDKSQNDANTFFHKQKEAVWEDKQSDAALISMEKRVSVWKKKDGLSLSVTRDKENGKPYFRELPEIHFSISHSGNIWSCAFSDCEIGLDLQAFHDRNCEKIARRFYHPMEIRWLEKNGFDQFSRIWAYKESYVKYTGDGLVNGLDYFSVVSEDFVEENDGKKNSKMETIKNAGELGAEGVCQQEVPFRDNFWMVVTSEKPAQVVLKKM